MSMRYQGGKARLGRRIAAVLESYRTPLQTYFEPFCGALGVMRYMTGERLASDINLGLITLFKAGQNGWIPPGIITVTEYDAIKAKNDLTDPLTAWAACACTFGAAWFGGFVDIKHRSVVQVDNFIKEAKMIGDVKFVCADYRNYTPHNQLIYCDPPYVNTIGYRFSNFEFDHDVFWNTMRNWSIDNTVIISELVAPHDFDCVATFKSNVQIAGRGNRPMRIEKLFRLRGA